MFVGVMAVLLAALIAFLYLHVRSDLDYTLDTSLRARAQEVASLVSDDTNADARGDLGTLPIRGDNFVQVLNGSGRVLGASAGFASPALLSAAEVRAAARSALRLQRGNRFRLYALPLESGRRIIVVGVSLSERDVALDKLDDALVLGVPPALLLASVAAYLLAAAALRPVERMRRRAALISTEEIGTRLPLPESQDEIRRLGMTLNAMLDRLQDGLVHERLFVANASHELRTPLAVLKAELEVSLREQGGEEHLRLAMTSAVEETDRIIKLAEDLLLLARAQDGTLPLEPQTLPVTELLSDLGEQFEARIERAGRRLIVNGAQVPPSAAVRVDPDRVHQAVANLVDNALRYGGGPVTLCARISAGDIELHVSDQGSGFGEEFVTRAFDRFSRADPARARGGVGLGLAIVRTIAQAHGGDASAADLPGGGADVWLRIPLAAQPLSGSGPLPVIRT